jgi:hypothetical protein
MVEARGYLTSLIELADDVYSTMKTLAVESDAVLVSPPHKVTIFLEA